MYNSDLSDHTMTQAVIRQPLTTQARVQSQFGSCGIFGGESDTGAGFCSSTSVLPPSV